MRRRNVIGQMVFGAHIEGRRFPIQDMVGTEKIYGMQSPRIRVSWDFSQSGEVKAIVGRVHPRAWIEVEVHTTRVSLRKEKAGSARVLQTSIPQLYCRPRSRVDW